MAKDDDDLKGKKKNQKINLCQEYLEHIKPDFDNQFNTDPEVFAKNE